MKRCILKQSIFNTQKIRNRVRNAYFQLEIICEPIQNHFTTMLHTHDIPNMLQISQTIEAPTLKLCSFDYW